MSLPAMKSNRPSSGTITTKPPQQTETTAGPGREGDEPQTDTWPNSSPSRTFSSTLITSATPSEILTAQSSAGADPTVSWGPAITASSLPSAAESGREASSVYQTSGMSHGARTALIATTTIGGTFILAFLIYTLWRRRKGATYSEIIKFRPRSDAMISSPGALGPDFTALPIYRESRYSVHSSKRGSMLSFSKLMRRRAPSPSSESFSKGPWLRNQRKAHHPPTPTTTGHPLSQVTPAPSEPSVRVPEMAYVPPAASSDRIRINRPPAEDDTSKPWLSIASREVPLSPDTSGRDTKSTLESPESPKSVMELQDQARWSWTNSQAPPAPRMRANSLTGRSSLSSSISLGTARRFRKVQSWIRKQGHDGIPEEDASRPLPAFKTRQKMPPLINKASFPTLAPVPVVAGNKLSKKPASRPGTAAPTSGQKGEESGVHRPKTAG